MKKLTKLPKTQFSGLEYNNLIKDIEQLVKESPDYNSSWDNFTESNAGRIIIELFSWIADQLATRIDWVANENFISTATQKKSIIKLLSLIGYKFALPKSAMVEINFVANSFFDGSGEYIPLSAGFSNNLDYAPFSLTGKDRNNGTKNFEALNYNETEKKFLYTKFNLYNDPLGKQSLNQTVNFYEGTTKVESFVVTIADGPTFNLNYGPIIQNSVSVFRGTEEMLFVPSFLSATAQRLENADGTINSIPYILKTTENNSLIVEFGTIGILPAEDRRLSIGDMIYVVYRIGGGILGNVAPNSVSDITTFSTTLGNTIQFSINNSKSGVGGEDAESIESALYNGTVNLRSAQKTVTKEDYEIILGAYSNILKGISYGLNNIESSYYSKYGVELNPYEVWNFVCLKKPGWDELKTSDYNIFNWVNLKLENRFNELISFGDGKFNNLLPFTSLTLTSQGSLPVFSQTLENFYNYIIIEPPDNFLNNLLVTSGGVSSLSKNFKVIPFKEEVDTVYFNYLLENSQKSKLFLTPPESESLSTKYINTSDVVGETNYSVTEKCNAEIFSNVGTVLFTPSSVKKTFGLSVDGRQITSIDFEEGQVYTLLEALPKLGVVEAINNLISLNYHGLDNNGDLNAYAFGYHNIGIKKGGLGISDIDDDQEEGNKLTATYLKAFDGGTGPSINEVFYLRLKVTTTDNGTISSTTYSKSFTLENETPTKEIVSLTLTSSTISDYSGKYFILYYKYTPHLVWIDTTGVDTKPEVSGFTSAESIKVSIVGASGIDGIGTAIVSGLTNSHFTSSFDTVGDVLSITVEYEGICTSANSGNLTSATSVASNFEISVVGKGEGAVEYPIVDDFNISSFKDVTAILNRRMIHTFELNVEAELNIFPNEEGMETCYDIRFKPLVGTNVIGVEVLKNIEGHIDKDIPYLLTEKGLSLPVCRPYGDYTNVASVIYKTINGTNTGFLKLTSPNIGEYSKISIVPKNTDTSFTTLTGIEHLTISGIRQNINCLGYKRFTLITNPLNINFGSFIYELSVPKIPFYYDKSTLYLNYVSNARNSISLGDTNAYYTSDTVNYIYNTGIKSNRDIDINKTNYIINFTKSPVSTNSIYTINNEMGLTLKKNVQITTAANNSNIAARVKVCKLGSLCLSMDYLYNDDANAITKAFVVDLSSCNGTKEIIQVTINNECSLTGKINLKLRGVTTEIDVTAGNTVDEIADLIAAKDQDFLAGGWIVTPPSANILTFTATEEGAKTGSNTLLTQFPDTGVVGSVSIMTTGADALMEDVYNKIKEEIIKIPEIYVDNADNYIVLNSDGSITIGGVKVNDDAQIRMFFSGAGTNVGNGDACISVLFGEFTTVFTGNSGIIGNFNSAGSFPVLAGNYYTAASEGDYSIIKEGSSLLMVKSQNSLNFPDISFYMHYINDRRHEIDINGNPAIIDEDLIKNYLNDYKIMGIENTIKQPKFVMFDIAGTVYCNSLFLVSEVKSNLEAALREQYGLNNSDFSKQITKSDIFKIITGIPGVRFAELTFLGTDYTDITTKVENTLIVDFDEIPVISDDIFDDLNKIHGIVFEYTTIS